MNIRAALITGTVLSLAAGAGLGFLATLTQGPTALPPLSARHPLASYLTLAAAATGNGWELFALVAFIYFLCLLLAAARRRRARSERPLPVRENR